MNWRRKWQPTPVFLPGESQGRRAWWAAVYGVAQSRTRLKWLSSSSSSRVEAGWNTPQQAHTETQTERVRKAGGLGRGAHKPVTTSPSSSSTSLTLLYWIWVKKHKGKLEWRGAARELDATALETSQNGQGTLLPNRKAWSSAECVWLCLRTPGVSTSRVCSYPSTPSRASSSQPRSGGLQMPGAPGQLPGRVAQDVLVMVVGCEWQLLWGWGSPGCRKLEWLSHSTDVAAPCQPRFPDQLQIE